MTEMHLSTVQQLWAPAIIHSGKNVENRVRNTRAVIGALSIIQAGLAKPKDEGGAYTEGQHAIHSERQGRPSTDDQFWEVADWVDPDGPRFIYGAIIGVVDLLT